MTMIDTIRRKLEAAFAPTELRIEDDSAQHAGHSGARPGGETHFSVRVVSEGFAGLSRVARQRSVYAALAEEMALDRIHALVLTTLTPAEASQGRRARAG